jgi:amino acid transporter
MASPSPELTPTAQSVRTSEPRHTLQGHLGVRDLVFTVLAYNAPLAIMAGYIPLVVGYGNGLGAPATFAAIGALLALFAVGLTAMSRFMRSPGAFYAYICAGIGRPAGLGGAFAAFAGYTAIAISSYAYGGIVVKALVEGLLNGPALHWWVWALVIWIVASGLSLLQIDLSAKVLGVAMIAEVVLVLIWDAAVFLDGGPEGIPTNSFTLEAFTSGSFAFAMLFGVLCITGFEAVAVFREETKDPVKTVPRATYTAVIFLAVLYCVGALAYLTALGPSEAVAAGATDPSGSFITSVDQYVGTVAVDVITVLLVTSVFAAILATQNISARYLYVLGEDGVIMRRFGYVHPRFGSPFIAAATVAVIAILGFTAAAISGIDPVLFYARLAGFGGVCLLTLMTATAVAIFVYFRRDDEHEANAFQSIVSPVLAFGGLAGILYLAAKNMGAVIGGTPGQGTAALLIGIAIIAAGVILALVLRSSRPEVYARIGKQDI